MQLIVSVFVCVCPRSNGYLCVCKQWAFSDNHMDVVDRLLIFFFNFFADRLFYRRACGDPGGAQKETRSSVH